MREAIFLNNTWAILSTASRMFSSSLRLQRWWKTLWFLDLIATFSGSGIPEGWTLKQRKKRGLWGVQHLIVTFQERQMRNSWQQGSSFLSCQQTYSSKEFSDPGKGLSSVDVLWLSGKAPNALQDACVSSGCGFLRLCMQMWAKSLELLSFSHSCLSRRTGALAICSSIDFRE